MWCSQSERTGMSRTSTSSSYPDPLSKVVRSKSGTASSSAYASTSRRGVSAMSGLSTGRPSAVSSAVAASRAVARSTSGAGWVTRSRWGRGRCPSIGRSRVGSSGRTSSVLTRPPGVANILKENRVDVSGAVGPGQGEDLVDEIGAVAVLAEPVRHRLYDAVASASGPIGREEAAQVAAVPLHSARFHLDKLVDAGLLEVSYARISGRSGPGAGRPAKLYRRSAVEVAVSLPRRSYDLVGSVLASAMERKMTGDEDAE